MFKLSIVRTLFHTAGRRQKKLMSRRQRSLLSRQSGTESPQSLAPTKSITSCEDKVPNLPYISGDEDDNDCVPTADDESDLSIDIGDEFKNGSEAKKNTPRNVHWDDAANMDSPGHDSDQSETFSQVVKAMDKETREALDEQGLSGDYVGPGSSDRDGAVSRQDMYKYSDDSCFESSEDDKEVKVEALVKQYLENFKDEKEHGDLLEIIARLPETSVLSDLDAILTISRCNINQTKRAMRQWAQICNNPFPTQPHLTKKAVIEMLTKKIQAKTAWFRDEISALFMQYYQIFEAMDKTKETQQHFIQLKESRRNLGSATYSNLPKQKASKNAKILAEQYLQTEEDADGSTRLLRLRSSQLVDRMSAIEEMQEVEEEEEEEEGMVETEEEEEEEVTKVVEEEED